MSAQCDAYDADECAMMRERSVAGLSDIIPPCTVHDARPDERERYCEALMGGRVNRERLSDYGPQGATLSAVTYWTRIAREDRATDNYGQSPA